MTPVELTLRIFLVLHLIGLASLLGGFLLQMKELKNGAKVVPAIFHGAWTLFVTGFVMTGLVYANQEEPNSIVIGIKSVVITAIFFLAYGYNKKNPTPKWVVPTIGLLTILNVAVAVIVGVIVEA
jgi:hypothetical protein